METLYQTEGPQPNDFPLPPSNSTVVQDPDHPDVNHFYVGSARVRLTPIDDAPEGTPNMHAVAEVMAPDPKERQIIEKAVEMTLRALEQNGTL
jgi:hypothetical protein